MVVVVAAVGICVSVAGRVSDPLFVVRGGLRGMCFEVEVGWPTRAGWEGGRHARFVSPWLSFTTERLNNVLLHG
jgi:hypothetical protein